MLRARSVSPLDDGNVPRQAHRRPDQGQLRTNPASGRVPPSRISPCQGHPDRARSGGDSLKACPVTKPQSPGTVDGPADKASHRYHRGNHVALVPFQFPKDGDGNSRYQSNYGHTTGLGAGTSTGPISLDQLHGKVGNDVVQRRGTHALACQRSCLARSARYRPPVEWSVLNGSVTR